MGTDRITEGAERSGARDRPAGGQARPLVLHFTDSLLPRTETFVRERLRERAFRAAAAAWFRAERGLDIPCPWRILDPRRRPPRGNRPYDLLVAGGQRMRRAADVSALLASAAPALVHAHFGTVAIGIRQECRLLGIPLVVSFYGYDIPVAPAPELRAAYQRLFSTAAALTAEGPVLARRLVALGAPREKVKLLPLALSGWAASPPERTPGRSGALRLVQVARFVEKKGIDTTLRAVRAAADAGVDVSLTLVGDGPLAGALRTLAAELAVEARVRFAGMLDASAIAACFARADAFIHPSKTARDGDTEGGYPTIVIEAQAQQLPVLATRHADIPVVVQHGVTGFLADEGDVAGVAAGIVELARAPMIAVAMGEAARRRALRRHDPERILGLRERIYRVALRSDGGRLRRRLLALVARAARNPFPEAPARPPQG